VSLMTRRTADMMG